MQAQQLAPRALDLLYAVPFRGLTPNIVQFRMSFGRTITLADGLKIPQIGLGTWLSKPHEVEDAVEHAIRSGYRHIDCARIYRNQDEVGRALKKVIPSVVKREDVWITSKLWNSDHQPGEVEKDLDDTLSQLGLDYLDLYCEFASGYERLR